LKTRPIYYSICVIPICDLPFAIESKKGITDAIQLPSNSSRHFRPYYLKERKTDKRPEACWWCAPAFSFTDNLSRAGCP